MAVQFITEDGTGKSNATAYITVAEFKQYWENRGRSFTQTDATIQAWINQATEYIDGSFQFKGCQVLDSQALQFPRYGVIKFNGTIIDSDIVPVQIKNSTAYIACQVGDSIILNSMQTNIKSETYGPVSKTFSGPESISFDYIKKQLQELIVSGNKIIRVN